MNSKLMKEYVESHPNLVSVKPTSREGLFVLKYKNKVFYKNLWTPELLECRGTIVDEDFNIISRPFTKIYNYGENNTSIDGESKVTSVKKINGFMAAATSYNGDLLVSTTGSIDSDFAKLAEQWIRPHAEHIMNMPNTTWIFEVCDESDPHIIKEDYGVYLLGIRYNSWDSPNHAISENALDRLAKEMGIYRPNHFSVLFKSLLSHVGSVEHEGYVCWDDNTELKLKSPYYLTTKFLARMKSENLKKALKNPESLKEKIDEEFYHVVDFLSGFVDEFCEMNEQDKIEFIRNYFSNEPKI